MSDERFKRTTGVLDWSSSHTYTPSPAAAVSAFEWSLCQRLPPLGPFSQSVHLAIRLWRMMQRSGSAGADFQRSPAASPRGHRNLPEQRLLQKSASSEVDESVIPVLVYLYSAPIVQFDAGHIKKCPLLDTRRDVRNTLRNEICKRYLNQMFHSLATSFYSTPSYATLCLNRVKICNWFPRSPLSKQVRCIEYHCRLFHAHLS